MDGNKIMKMNEKLKSRKFLVACWAMCLLTVAIFMKIDLGWFSGVAQILAAIILAYVTGQTFIDHKGVKKDDNSTDPVKE